MSVPLRAAAEEEIVVPLVDVLDVGVDEILVICVLVVDDVGV